MKNRQDDPRRLFPLKIIGFITAGMILTFSLVGIVLALAYDSYNDVQKKYFRQKWNSIAFRIASEASDSIDKDGLIDDNFASYLYKLPGVSNNVGSLILVDRLSRPIFSTGNSDKNDNLLISFAAHALNGSGEIILPTESGLGFTIVSMPVMIDSKIEAALVLMVEEAPDAGLATTTIYRIAGYTSLIFFFWSVIVVLAAYMISRIINRREIMDNVRVKLFSLDADSSDLDSLLRKILSEAVFALGAGSAYIFIKNRISGEIDLFARYAVKNSGRYDRVNTTFVPGDPRLQALTQKQPVIYKHDDSGRISIIDKIDKNLDTIGITYPLISNFEAFGILDFRSFKGKLVNSSTMDSSLSISELMSLSLHRILFLKETRKRLEYMRFVLETVEASVSSNNVTTMLNNLSLKIAAMKGISFCRIFTLADGGRKLILIAENISGEGISSNQEHGVFEIDELPIHKLSLLSGQSQILHHEEIEKVSPENRKIYGPEMENCMLQITPLQSETRQLGCLEVGIRETGEFPSDLKTHFENIAHYVSLPIQNTIIYSNMKKAFQRMTGAQERRVQFERLRAIGDFAEGISNRLAGAIDSLKLNVDVLSNSTPDQDYDQLLEKINAGIDEYDRVIREFKAYSSIGKTGELHQVELAQILLDIADKLKTDPKLFGEDKTRFGLTVKNAGSGQIMADPDDIHEMIRQIVSNAVQAMPNGGEISIESMLENAMAIIEIADMGTGMTEEIKARVFEPFFTSRPGVANGLGMYIVHRIVAAHRGVINIESEPGQGSRIIIRIPLVDPEQTALYSVKKSTSRSIPLSTG